MKLTAKITRIKRKSGFTSLRLAIVHYFRDGFGRPRHKIIAPFPTVRSDTTHEFAVRKKFWILVEKEIRRLLVSKIATPQDLAQIEQRFSEIVPRPKLTITLKPVGGMQLRMESKYQMLRLKRNG